MVAEAHADEDDGKDGEAHELNLLSAPRVDEDEGQVVARDETADGEDDVADSDVVQSLVGVDGFRGAVSVGPESDRGEDLGRVETEACMSAWTQPREASQLARTVESNVKCKPTPSGTKEHLEVLPLPEVSGKVSPRGLGQFGPLVVVDRVDDVRAGGKIGVDVLRGLLDVSLDVHGVSRRLGDGKSEVEGDSGRDHAETDNESPDLVDGLGIVQRLSLDLALEGGEYDDGNNGRSDWHEWELPSKPRGKLTVTPALG